MQKATVHNKERTILRWSPAKIVLMQSQYGNTGKQNDIKEIQEETTKEKKDKEVCIKFCEPVFKPKKHEFL